MMHFEVVTLLLLALIGWLGALVFFGLIACA